MLASELYALSNSTRCSGEDECHWCTAKCGRLWPHDEPPRIMHVRQSEKSKAKRPGNYYICTGCWHWRRKSVTVRYMDGTMTDRKEPQHFSWWITLGGAISLREKNEGDASVLYENLLFPPFTFCLTLLKDQKINLLQHSIVNDYDEITADMDLSFTVDNVELTYNIYELEQALRNQDVGGTSPGVQALIRMFGMPEAFAEKPAKKIKGGQVKKMEEDPSYRTRVIRQK